MQKPLTGSFELIKNLNTACILNMIRIKESISRADIARGSGLTPATVSNITSELIDLGLIIETERGESSGGRKPILLSINKQACYFGAVHIGSNNIEATVCDVGARILNQFSLPVSNITPERAVDLAIALLDKARTAAGIAKLSGIGICTHGLVRSEDGVIVFAPNLGWSDIKIGEMFEKASGLPVYVENDVRAMALAESWCGIACGVKDYTYLYIGPGVGGSIINNNELYLGPGGFAGEFGHSTVVPDGPICTCKNRGCLQAVASETAVFNNYKNRKQQKREPLHCSNYEELIIAAKSSDMDAREEIIKSVRYIAIEVGNIINTLSPDLIIINGKFTELGEPVIKIIEGESALHSLGSAHAQTKIVFSPLGNSAPIKGAATCVIRQMFKSPKKFLEKQ